MMVMSEIFREFEAGELVVGRDSAHDPSPLKIREKSVGRASRHVGNRAGDVRDAQGTPRGREEFNHGLTPRGVTLVDSTKVDFDQFVQGRER
jgi:hypothetical protein